MNSNYRRGRAFEYERMKHYKEVMKQDVVRTAGSHGQWDLISTDWSRGIVTYIQCKVVSTQAEAARLLSKWQLEPPFSPRRALHQTMEVKVKGSREVLSVTV